MSDNSLKTLFHPFETGGLPVPPKGSDVLFLGAEPGFRLPDGWVAPIHAAQGFRPDFRALERMGLTVTPRAEGDNYDTALVLAGRHRGQNELRIADAVERAAPNGLIVVAGSRDDGIASLRKRMEGLVDIQGSLPKYHGLAFWFRQTAGVAALALRAANPPLQVEGRYRTAPGMFSHDAIDPGSKLLARNLPVDLHGHIADFGAGWGYLAGELLSRSARISRMDLYEADFEALEAARRNLATVRGDTATEFFWIDLLSERAGPRYDLIVMNPPFHAGRAAEPAIGQGMIAAAARALKPGGRLLLVANRRLPYERVLAKEFREAGETARDARYKVLWAVR